MDPQTPKAAPFPQRLTRGWSWAFIAFGLYLLAGACAVITTGKWPVFMPGQFDILALVLGAWGGAALLMLCGGGCVWHGYKGLWRNLEAGANPKHGGA
jgi:hypothetical protein